MLKKIGADAQISSDPSLIAESNKLILPGVGAFDAGMKHLTELKLIPILEQKVLKEKIPILGICLGMQLMTKTSEEGQLQGLGWFNATTIRFKFKKSNPNIKVPHMGWNFIKKVNNSPLLTEVDENFRFYFIHSYHVSCAEPAEIVAETNHLYDFVSIIQKDNIFGVQFHPEKSHRFGMKILKNFVEY
jgi:imidazole glycerol-phosphate synthase subunit HisH